MVRFLASLGAWVLLTTALLWVGPGEPSVHVDPGISCWWEADLEPHEGQLVLADEITSCWVPDIDADIDEYGIVVLGTPLYLISFALPPGTVDGWVHYSYMNGYATVNGHHVMVLIELREEI